MRILESDLKQSEFARSNYTLVLPESGTLEDATKASTYANVVRKLKRFDLIEVIAHDGTWEALLRVRAVAGLDIRFGLLLAKRHEDQIALNPDDYLVEPSGGTGKYRIIRIDDKKVMVDDLTSEEAAYTWLMYPPAADAIRPKAPVKKAA